MSALVRADLAENKVKPFLHKDVDLLLKNSLHCRCHNNHHHHHHQRHHQYHHRHQQHCLHSFFALALQVGRSLGDSTQSQSISLWCNLMVNIVVLMIVMVMMMSPSEVTLWIRLTKMMITRRNIGESNELAGMAIFVDIAWQHSIGWTWKFSICWYRWSPAWLEKQLPYWWHHNQFSSLGSKTNVAKISEEYQIG